MNGRDNYLTGADGRIPDRIPHVPLPEGNDPEVVRQYARRVLDAFGLAAWTFAFDNGRRRMGLCDHRRKRITLSRHFVALNSPEEIRDTVLHEVAHALVGPAHGHDATWRSMCRRVGCKPQRCGQADMPAGNVVAVCGGCTRLFCRHRRPRAGVRHWCRRCGPVRGLLTWAKAQET